MMPDDLISCPHCGGSERLEFLPMLYGEVYAQCPCGFGWEVAECRKPEVIQ